MMRTWMVGKTVRSCVRKHGTSMYACKLTQGGRVSWVYWTTHGSAFVKAPKGSGHVQHLLATPGTTHPGGRIKVTQAPVRVYH